MKQLQADQGVSTCSIGAIFVVCFEFLVKHDPDSSQVRFAVLCLLAVLKLEQETRGFDLSGVRCLHDCLAKGVSGRCEVRVAHRDADAVVIIFGDSE